MFLKFTLYHLAVVRHNALPPHQSILLNPTMLTLAIFLMSGTLSFTTTVFATTAFTHTASNNRPSSNQSYTVLMPYQSRLANKFFALFKKRVHSNATNAKAISVQSIADIDALQPHNDQLAHTSPTVNDHNSAITPSSLKPITFSPMLLKPIIAVGSRSLELLKNHPSDRKIIVVLVTYASVTDKYNDNYHFLFSDPNPFQQISLIKQVLGARKQITFLYNGVAEHSSRWLINSLTQAAESEGISLLPRSIESIEQLTALSSELDYSDGVLIYPDKLFLNRDNLRTTIKTLYRKRIPVFGYNPNIVKAGALATVFVDMESIVESLVKVLNRIEHQQYHSRNELNAMNEQSPYYKASSIDESIPQTLFIDSVHLSMNPRVAKSLMIQLPHRKHIMENLKTLHGYQ